MNLEELAAKVNMLEAKQQRTEDVEAIKKLQRSYGYYLEHWQVDEIVALFSHSPEVSVEINDSGLYKGYEAVKNSFRFEDHYTAYNGQRTAPPYFLHILCQLPGL